MTIKSILTGIVLAAGLTGQATREHSVVLRNWPAPLYWQPSPAASEAAGERALAPKVTPAVSLIFVAMTPCRVVDTRASQMFAAPFGAPGLTSGPARSFPIQASTLCSIPATAQAYSFNVTVVPPGVLGYLKIYPAGVPEPNAVTLDDLLGTIVNNAAIVPAGTPNGSISAVVNGNTDLVLDINGYYAQPNPTVNTANGLNALASNTTGTDNTADGYGTLFSNTAGSYNTASGALALNANTTGNYNTASGFFALNRNSTGSANTAIGDYALSSNTAGGSNTATGYNALTSNTTGSTNVAIGTSALSTNTSGTDNVAIGGYGALYSNTTASGNTAIGDHALFSNTTGYNNTAIGVQALFANTTGAVNVASGDHALFSNTSGNLNIASGYYALYHHTTGDYNIASGVEALFNNSTGTDNIAIGHRALYNTPGGYNIAIGLSAGMFTSGSNNIYLGNDGENADNNVIRIGQSGGHMSFFAAGIKGVTTGQPNATPVMIDSNGQLGTQSSSRRFKENIQDMSEASSGLLRLRPVTFNYLRPYADGSKPLDYGLIAEEVADVYPDLVARGVDGQIETVQYQKLTPMLLNELQKLQAEVAALHEMVETLLSERRARPVLQQ